MKLKFFLFYVLFYFYSYNLYSKSIDDSFADLVEDLIPAVVSIASTTIINDQPQQNIPQFPEGSPFDEFFKDYFNRENRNSPSQRPLVGLGSGFIIDASGIVVTNNHVIESADEITIIMSNQKEYKAKLLGRDPKADLAVLKFDPEQNNLKSVKWGNSENSRVGDWTIAIGNPLGLGGTVTAGIISAIARDIGGGPYVKFIQTDASINRGNSGGPLFNTKGEVIGINSAIISQTGGSIGLGFAIPSNSAKKIVSQLIEFGRTKRGYLGVEITNVNQDIVDSLGLSEMKGAFVSSLNPSGPAKKAGIQEGDVILKFNNIDINKMSDLPRLVAESEIGSVSMVEVWRKDKVISIEVELGELPEKSYVNRLETKKNIEEEFIKDLGITIIPAEDKSGVEISKIEKNVELLKGDIIIEVNREKIFTVSDFVTLIKTIKKTGRQTLLLKVLREDKSIWITIKFTN